MSSVGDNFGQTGCDIGAWTMTVSAMTVLFVADPLEAKTSDGTRHEESIEGESREAVFSALREKGIKAIKVVAADGSKANGEIRGYRLRTVILVGVIAVLIGFVFGLMVRGFF